MADANNRRKPRPTGRAARRRGSKSPHPTGATERGEHRSSSRTGRAVTVSALVLASGVLATIAYALRSPIAGLAERTLKQSRGELDDLLARAGVRSEPLYLRALPGVGILAGLLALGSAGVFLGPRLRGLLPDGGPERLVPSIRPAESASHGNARDDSARADGDHHAY